LTFDINLSMKNINYFNGKRITIIGLARSGLACANLLFDLGASVTVSDNQDNAQTRLNAAKLKSQEIELELGRHSEDFVRGRDFIIISPGVSEKNQAFIWARQSNIPIISEIEVASILCPAPIIAVTGSNGKTTTATLIGKVIEASGKKAFVCGNIGNPFCGELEKIEAADFVVLEVSSFQLETIQSFHPKIALILNFSRNHLDRYSNMQEYLEAKKKIFMNQGKGDFLVLNSEDSVLKELGKEARSKVVFFKAENNLNPNQAAVLSVASILGIGKEACLQVFNEFKGIEHRMEQVAEINNVRFINDSKATTVESCMWALDNISSPVILIAGGKDKGVDYNIILEPLRRKVKEVILIGEAKKKLDSAFRGHIALDEANSLEEAVQRAYFKASPGDCVLLSPMCASFDMFANYEERGRVFKRAVSVLAKEKKSNA